MWVGSLTNNTTNFQRCEIGTKDLSESHERLELLAEFAGHVGHDFNNLFGIVLNYAILLERQLAADATALSDLAQIRAAMNQAVSINRALLTFAGRNVPAPERGDLNEFVRSAVATYTDNRPESTARLELFLAPAPLPVEIDPAHVQALVDVLVTNAVEASEPASSVEISTARGADAAVVTLTARDRGVGMTDETLTRAFDPFFTTKPRRIGSGLGLTVVHGIAQCYGGTVTIESELDHGTTVTVLLPAADRIAPG